MPMEWKDNYWLKPDKDPNVRTWAYRLWIEPDDNEWDNPEYGSLDSVADYIVIAHKKIDAEILAKRFCKKMGFNTYQLESRWGASSEEMKGLWAKTANVKTVGGGKYTPEYERLKEMHLATVKVRRPGIYKPRGREPIFE